MPDLSHKYLRVQDLRRLRNMLFSSRRPVEGLYAGRHASPQRGHSVEFSDYRQYMPGDEIGDIDWKVYARSDKLFVRLFEHQSDMTVHLLVDASASMGYGGVEGRKSKVESQKSKVQGGKSKVENQGSKTFDSGPLTFDSKYDYACRMAAAIAFLTTRQQDRVSFGIAHGGLIGFQRPQGSPSHLLNVLAAMERVTPGGEAKLAVALTDMASRLPRRGLLIVMSDLLDDPDPILRAMSLFTHRGGEVVVFHILHPDELMLPQIEDAVFTDSETGGRVALNVADVRQAYGERMQRFLRTWATGCQGRGFDYQLVNTGAEYWKALEHYLFRKRRS